MSISLCFSSPDVAVDTHICGQRWGTAAAQEVAEAHSLQTGFAQG